MSDNTIGLNQEADSIEFELAEAALPGSGEFIITDKAETSPTSDLGLRPVETEELPDELAGRSPAFRELALPKLPELQRGDRAWLQLQSPNRLYFYWSIKNDPFNRLKRLFGQNAVGYNFVIKLIDIDRDAEELFPADIEGSWWFNVAAGRDYRAELGFYAPNRPFVRVLYSETVGTPRKNPSPRPANEAEWRIPAQKFAEVLDVSGFKQDAFDVAMAGDDIDRAESSSHRAFAKMTAGRADIDTLGFDAEELRYVMLAIASGATLEQLRHRISEKLFAFLRTLIDGIDKERALTALRSEFDIAEEELLAEEEEFGPAVFGVSLVNFPKNTRLRTKPRGFDRFSKFEPVASHSVLG